MSDIEGDAVKAQEWEQLYELLIGILGEYGRDYSSGDDFDYFVIDDEYGDRHHKIEVVNPAFWSDAIQQRIRDILATSFPAWGVFVDLPEDAEGSRWFVLYADRVEFGPPASAANIN